MHRTLLLFAFGTGGLSLMAVGCAEDPQGRAAVSDAAASTQTAPGLTDDTHVQVDLFDLDYLSDHSCDDDCGSWSGSGVCYCDTVCTLVGDCCPDYASECLGDAYSCLASNTCNTKTPGGCYCDSKCEFFGDCCYDADSCVFN